MTEAILEKIQRFAAVSGVVIGTASPVQRPPAAQLCPASPERGSRSPSPATARPRQTGDEARTDGIGDAREHGADDAAELAFHVNKIPISAAIEGRGAQEMVGWCCVEESVRFAHRTLVPAETGGGHVDQHKERRARDG
jgi:hypothetical protein